MQAIKGYSDSSDSSSRIVDIASIVSASIMRVWPVSRSIAPWMFDALAPARLFDRELLFLRGPATHGPRRVGGMHRVHEYRDLVVALGIQQVFVARDKRLLRFGV